MYCVIQCYLLLAPLRPPCCAFRQTFDFLHYTNAARTHICLLSSLGVSINHIATFFQNASRLSQFPSLLYYIRVLLQCDIQMFTCQHRLRTWNQHNSLCIIDDHRGSFDRVAHLECREQEDRRVIDAPDFSKVDAVLRVDLRRGDGACLDLGNFGEDSLAESVERLADPSDLAREFSGHDEMWNEVERREELQ